MRKTSILVSFFATGSVLALAAAAPASAQTYNDPFGPIGQIVTAPVAAAGQIVEAPIAATANVMAPVVVPVAQTNNAAAFVANVIPNVNFLNDASRLALSRSSDPMVRRIAHKLAVQQTIAGNSMTAWADTNSTLMTGRSAYAGDPILGLATLPINTVVGIGSVVTGGTIVASNEGRALLNSQANDLARLNASNGRNFDILYRDTQIDALRQLVTLYSDYAVNGVDPGLRRLARAELPKVQARIDELSRI